jgi:iron complex outermembrane recepter protein
MRGLLATSAMLTLAIATQAGAQSSPPPSDVTPVAGEEAPIATPSEGEVLVTARRREESIRDIPGTINALSDQQLQAKGPVQGVGDLLNAVPGVRFNGVGAENLSEVSIRGSGTQRATGADSGIGLFVNGAYAGSQTLGGRNFKNIDYFDIDRVEVLEGPQGALYGRNSEFGTINLVLAKPRFDSSGYARGTYTFGLRQGRMAAVVNEALDDDNAIRVGGEVYGQRKGFYYDPNNNRYYDNTSGALGRVQGRHRSGDLDVTVLLDAQDLRLPSFVNSLEIPPGTNAQIPLGLTQDRFIVPHDGRDGLQQTVARAMILASYDLGWATLSSTTMAVRWRSQQQFAATTDYATLVVLRQQGQIGGYPFNQTTTDVRDRTFYQDVHLSGKLADDSVLWTFGGEALRQRDYVVRTVATSPCTFTLNAGVCGGTPTAPVCLRPLPTSANCPTPFPLAFGTETQTRQKIGSLAAYASLQYNLGNFAFTGEGRLTRDRKAVNETAYRLYTRTLSRPIASNRFRASQPAWTLTAAWKSPDATNTLLYGKVGTGYRAGGVNLGVANPAAPNPFQAIYGIEDTISYELGVKSNLTRTIFARVSAYKSRTNDAITSIIDGCTVTNACGTGGQIFNVNGGTIHAKGVEAALDGRFQVGGGGLLSVSLNAATQEAIFAKVPAGVSGLPIPRSDVAQIPDWTMSATVDFRHPITPRVTGFVNVNYSGQRGGAQDTTTLATPRIDLEDFDLIGMRAGIEFGTVQLAAFVKNLTDKGIRVLQFQQGGFPLSSRWNQPRTYGLTASYRW